MPKISLEPEQRQLKTTNTPSLPKVLIRCRCIKRFGQKSDRFRLTWNKIYIFGWRNAIWFFLVILSFGSFQVLVFMIHALLETGALIWKDAFLLCFQIRSTRNGVTNKPTKNKLYKMQKKTNNRQNNSQKGRHKNSARTRWINKNLSLMYDTKRFTLLFSWWTYPKSDYFCLFIVCCFIFTLKKNQHLSHLFALQLARLPISHFDYTKNYMQ